LDLAGQGCRDGHRRRPDRIPADLVDRAPHPRGVAARLHRAHGQGLRDRDPDGRDVLGGLGVPCPTRPHRARPGTRPSRRRCSAGRARPTAPPASARHRVASRWRSAGSHPAPGAEAARARRPGWIRRRLWCRFLCQGSGNQMCTPASDASGSISRSTSTASCMTMRTLPSSLLAHELEQRTHAGRMHLDAQQVVVGQRGGDGRGGVAHAEADLQHARRTAAEHGVQVQRPGV
jgi:hypothetical protein